MTVHMVSACSTWSKKNEWGLVQADAELNRTENLGLKVRPAA
jgi:hypothetical protein